jgi:replication factor C subunit 2/4
MSNPDHIPWIEKYRPRNIDNLVLDDTTKKKVNNIMHDKIMPNIIITGPPGVGKTTSINCIVRSLYGPYVNDAVLELNASDDRGKAVYETIMNFCKKQLDLNEKHPGKYATHKIIILDEADNMTVKAQTLINNLMTKYHSTTRFAFTCNDSEDIIECIQSRCTIMKYFRLTKAQIVGRLTTICAKENVKYNDNALEIIASLSQGDVRHAINNLQLIHNCHGDIDADTIYTICDKPQPVIINNLFDACIKKDFKTAVKIAIDLKVTGFSESDIILNMIHVLRNEKTNLDELTTNKFLDKICLSAYIVSKGLDTPLQLSSCISTMISSL